MMTRTALNGAPTVSTRVNFWPALIDMLTSMLMFFLLLYFVEHHFNSGSAELAVARQRQARFTQVFNEEFRNEIAAGDITATPDLKILQIRFGERVLFHSRSYDLLPSGQALMERLARVLHRFDDAADGEFYEQIQIEGHTDDLPLNQSYYPHDNWELSTARAMEVLKFLTRRAARPLREDRMSVNGYAQNRPISTHRSRNRRIELRIYFSGREPASAGAAR
jgi:flagellar motor protein MotB